MRANFSKAPAGRSSTLKLQCRYTNQMTRKKKTWQEGYAKIVPTGNSFLVQLFDSNDLRDQSLEGRLMTPKEAEFFHRKALLEMKLSNHLIEFNFDAESTPYVAPVKVTKFKPPSVLARPQVVPEQNSVFEKYNNPSMRFNNYGPQDRYQQSHEVNSAEDRAFRGNSREDEDEDLDELWHTGPNKSTSGVIFGHNQTKQHFSNNEDELNNETFQHRNSHQMEKIPYSNNNVNDYDLNSQINNHFHESNVEQRHPNIVRQIRNNQEMGRERETHVPSSSWSREDVSFDVKGGGERRKRPNSEITRTIDDTALEQTSRRAHFEPVEDSNIRGSMKRVDASIWDD